MVKTTGFGVRHGVGRTGSWFALLLCLALSALSSTSFAAAGANSTAATAQSPLGVPNRGADLWRDVRRATRGKTQIAGPETGVLVNASGEQWRQIQTGPVIRYGGWALFLVLLAVLAFHVFHGGVRLEGGRTGKTVFRWHLYNRVIHWYTATLFIIQALTGLSLLFGKHVLMPLIGKPAFGAYAETAKTLHNYLGLPFVLGVVLTVLLLFRHNLFERCDWKWMLKGGGLIAKSHPPAGFVNLGEKLLTYWVIATVGVVACISGLVLDFPNFGQVRETMQIANIVHGVATVIWVFLVIGHIYLSTAGVEGTFEAMWTGRVDQRWAELHHSLWYQEIQQAESNPAGDPTPDKQANA